MIKKIIIGILVLGIVLLAGWKLFLGDGSGALDIASLKENLSAYHMEATMEINEGEDKKNYFVTVDYKKETEQDYFRISLLDTSSNQEQILIRNEDGVFVLTPLLNQVYKFKGDYPLNSPKPYLYHSMLNAFDEEHELKSMSDGYLLSFTPKYNHQKSWTKEDIKFSSDLKPVWVNIYDNNSSLVSTILFSKVDLNPTYDEMFFNVEENMKKARENMSSTTSNIEDLPFLPVSSNSSLVEQTEATVNNETCFILCFEGEQDYKVIQKIIEPSAELVYIDNNGEYQDTLFGIGYLKNNYYTYISGNVCYEVYSTDLEVLEMISVASSMEVSAAK